MVCQSLAVVYTNIVQNNKTSWRHALNVSISKEEANKKKTIMYGNIQCIENEFGDVNV